MANACGACQFRIVGLHAFPPVEPIRAIQIQGADMHRRSRGTICPRFAWRSPSKGGSGGHRVRAAPAFSCANARVKTHTSIQVQRKHSGIPRAMALRLMA